MMLQSHYSLFDTFFAPTRVVVVSEERLRKAEKEARDDEEVEALDYSEEDPSRVAFDLTKGGTDTIGTEY